MPASALVTLSHGWTSIGLGYAGVCAPMMAGLIRAKAGVQRILLSPLIAIPATVAAGVAIATVSPAVRALGSSPESLMQLAVNVGLSVGTGYLTGRLIGRAAEFVPSHQRGAAIASAQDADRSRQPSAGNELMLAGIPVPAADETKHFKFIGTTGTGKSTAITQLLEGALARGDRAVIADPDGGYLRRFYDPARGDIILNPFDQRSRKWDLFAEIRHRYDIDQLARALIPDQDGDKIWTGYGRTFFSSVTRQSHAQGVRDLAELFRILTIAGTSELRNLTEGTPAQAFLEPNNERMFHSLRSVSNSAVAPLEYVAKQEAEGFSIRGWVEREHDRKGGVLFIPYRAGQIAALRSTISAWMRIAIFGAMDRPEGDQRLWFVIDELDALGPIDGLKDALARVRKFGGRCVLGFQSIAQVAGTYGEGQSRTIVENCGNTVIFRCSASEGGGTSRFASTLIGQRQVRRTFVSRSTRDTEVFGSSSTSEQVTIEPAVMDSEIEQLQDLCGYLKFAGRADWMRVRVPAAVGRSAGATNVAAFVPVAERMACAEATTEVPAGESSVKPKRRGRARTAQPGVGQSSAAAVPKRASRARKMNGAANDAGKQRSDESRGAEP